MFYMNNRGELTSKQIIGLVLAIVGFVIVLILLFSLEFESFTESETCKLSVLSRATVKTELQSYVPLKCTTGKICLTAESNGKCEQFIGEKGVMTVKLPKNNAQEASEIIEKESANAMFDCWNMMGQGKLDLFSGSDDSFLKQLVNIDDLGREASTCVICSRVALDKDFVYEKEDEKFTNEFTNYFEEVANNVDVNDYMRDNPSPDGSGLSYLQAMSNRQVNGFSKEFDDQFKAVSEREKLTKAIDQTAFTFMQINTKGSPLEKGLDTGGRTFLIGEGLLLSTGTAWSVPTQLFNGLVTIGTGGIAAYQQYEGRKLSIGYCGEFTSTNKAKEGCSLVLPLDYSNIGIVNQYCKKIQGSP